MKTLRPLCRGCWVCKFEVYWECKGVSNCFGIVIYFFMDIPEGKDWSCVKHGIAGLRYCVRCLLTMDKIQDLRESDNWHVRQTMHAKEEYPRLMRRAEMMDRNDVYREKPDLVHAGQDKMSVMSIFIIGTVFGNILGSRCRACYLTCTACSGLNLNTTYVFTYQNAIGEQYSALTIEHIYYQPGTYAEQVEALERNAIGCAWWGQCLS